MTQAQKITRALQKLAVGRRYIAEAEKALKQLVKTRTTRDREQATVGAVPT